MSKEIARILADFKTHAGRVLEHNTPRDVALKYVLRTAYPRDWTVMLKNTFPYMGEDELKENIDSLRRIQLKDLYTASALRRLEIVGLLLMPDYDGKGDISVRGRSTHRNVSHYVKYREEISSNVRPFNEFPDAGMTMCMADENFVKFILHDRDLKNFLSLETQQVEDIEQVFSDYNKQDRRQKLEALCHLLSYARLDMSPSLESTFMENGLIDVSHKQALQVRRKTDYKNEMATLLEERQQALDEADEFRMKQEGHDMSEYTRRPDREQQKKDIKITNSYLRDKIAVLRKYKLDDRGMRRKHKEAIVEQDKERQRLLRNADILGCSEKEKISQYELATPLPEIVDQSLPELRHSLQRMRLINEALYKHQIESRPKEQRVMQKAFY